MASQVQEMGSGSQRTPFGKPMREHFLFEENFVNLNHGSFGTYPLPVRTALHQFQDLAEAAPDKFNRYDYQSYLMASRIALAKLLNVPLDTCVFVQNATLGVNTVLRNLVYGPGDVIVYFDTIYGACEKTIASILETNPQVRARKVDGYTFPCTHAEVIDRFLEVVSELQNVGLKAKVAVFETISALPGVRNPFERLTEECKRLGVLSCVDAAHGVGQIPLALRSLDPDFLVTNCHKWLFTPRGCALFYVPSRNHTLIRTTFPTSHGFVPRSHQSLPSGDQIHNPLPQSPSPSTPSSSSSATDFINLFQFVATVDNGPYYCVPAALEFRRDICGGEDVITCYIRDLAKKGGDIVANILGTEVMSSTTNSASSTATDPMRDCAFANVRLPVPSSSSSTPPQILVTSIQERLMTPEFNTFIAVYSYAGKLWTRLSAQVYLDEQDFVWAARALHKVCSEI